ncbi:GOLPH3/VPS74 family protein [Kribbella sp. DT2]|uniref:GOLPH3/VPS74 family protein n=1 Tax=Kribbella sp. DT2 TaxID=3393427 RepID=UPI003CF482AC
MNARQNNPRQGAARPNRRPERPQQAVAPDKGTPPGLAERLYLLAFDPATSKLANKSRLGLMLRAAALIDLQLDGRLTEQDGRVVASRGVAASPLAADVLAQVESGGRKRWKYWVERRARHALPMVRDELERRHLIKVEPYRRFGLFPAQRITLRQPLVRRQLLHAATDALRPARLVSRVDPRDAALVVLASTGELKPVLSRAQRKQHKDRLAQLEVLAGPAVPALRKVIQQRNAAAANSGGGG